MMRQRKIYYCHIIVHLTMLCIPKGLKRYFEAKERKNEEERKEKKTRETKRNV